MAAPASRPLIDGFGRRISYVRLSVTDRCDFRCTYCMPSDMTFLPKADILTLEELALVAEAFIARGVTRLRLTGGEPLVRRDMLDLVQRLGRHVGSGLDELTLTTNGSQLARFAEPLFRAGVRRVNVSLDTLDPARFTAITRRGQLAPVLDGIAAAKAAGLAVKINMVALKGLNEDEIEAMLAWCAREGHALTLIETMPLGQIEEDRTDRYLPLSEIRRRLETRFTLTPLTQRTGGPARYLRIEETGQTLGLITPLTHNFCESCNRVRVTATGTLFMCLGQEDRLDLRDLLRQHGPAALDAALDRAMQLKPKGHDFVIERREAAPAVARHMSMTGG
ncbi:GTP 3',8-cyclase MoaA [Sandaracinobacteroides saxicola]|uniref:GTP 3',8-cyclase n=1 Tax=Sandaracinobacteroides saxicola TaxID=2759707 RepID=A0A7G5IEC7_9SPHN|nr:GTP 3',8-cyclase MoaA [Sandaracinobacteroides saxicola]QMW21719.1 GTP 3',8-cyclase MoaA [Sandaracinobacteroides saxicola]